MPASRRVSACNFSEVRAGLGVVLGRHAEQCAWTCLGRRAPRFYWTYEFKMFQDALLEVELRRSSSTLNGSSIAF